MSSNQRSRGNRGNNQGGNNQGNGNGGNRQPKQAEVKDFWGESVAPLPQLDAPSGANDPSAMVRSLGKPPLPGNDNAQVEVAVTGRLRDRSGLADLLQRVSDRVVR